MNFTFGDGTITYIENKMHKHIHYIKLQMLLNINMGLCKSGLRIAPIVACSIVALMVSHKNKFHLSSWKLKHKEFQR